MIFINVIYIDVLFLTNFVINLSFLLLTKKLTHSYSSNFSVILASIVGSFSSLVILSENQIVGIVIKFIVFVLQIGICFKTANLKRICKLSVIYFLINISYAGLAVILWNFLNRKIIYIKNITVYFDIDTGTLIGLTIVIYVIITVWEAIKNRHFVSSRTYTVRFEISGQKFELKGLSDTGNQITDCYYGKPVAVVTSDEIYETLNLSDEVNIIKNKLHILPCKTVSGSGILYVTRPIRIEINDGNTAKKCEACVGICRQNEDNEKCIFNPKILI